MRSALGFSPKKESGSGVGWTIANVVRPSSETKVSSPVEAYEAMRAWGSARSSRASIAARSRFTAGESTDSPSGIVTTGTSGGDSPPVPR